MLKSQLLPLQKLNGLQSIQYSWRGIWHLLSPYHRSRTLVIYAFNILIGLADIVGLGSMVPVLMLAIDHSFLEKSRKLRAIYYYFNFSSEASFLVALIIFILLFFLVKSLFAFALQRFTKKVSVEISSQLSARSFDYAFRNNSYEKVSNDGLGFNDTVLFTPYYFVSGIYLPLINIVTETAVVFMLILGFTIYNPMIFFLITGLLGTAFVFVNRYTRKRISNLGEQASMHRDDALKGLNFGISGFADIRTHGVEAYFKSRFLKDFNGYVASGIKGVNFQLIPARINEFVSLLGIVVLVVYAYFYSGDNIGQVRVLAALFAISVFRLIPAANRILQGLMHLKMNAYTLEKLMPVTEVPETKETVREFKTDIQFSQIHFAYPGKESQGVFEGMDFVLEKGKTIGIAGESGAGKTSLIKLLLGFYEPQSGEIRVDGELLNQQFAHHTLFSYMGQEPFMVSGTVADNVALGIEPAQRDLARMEDCLGKAAFRLNGHTDVLNIQVGEGGSMLSEGQKQRLVLARELYRNAPVLILDEPTSALDTETENDVMHTLKMLKESGKTMLIIAHRQRIFELCDLVYEIKDKKLKPRT